MAYISDWESLASSLTRVAASGSKRMSAKKDLCNAIADGKIRLRAFLSEHDEFLPGHSFSGQQIQIPQRLKPSDFDWKESRPVKQWLAGTHRIDETGRELRNFDVVELRTEDVISHVCSSESTLQSVPAIGSAWTLGHKSLSFPKADVEAAYKQRVKEFEGKTSPSRDEDARWCKENFGIGRTRAREIRKKFAPPNWQEHGRRSANKSDKSIWWKRNWRPNCQYCLPVSGW